MSDRAYIVSRALENKIAIAENNDQNTLLVTLDALKEIIAVLKEQEPPTSEELKAHYGELYKCKGCGLEWYQQVQRYCLHCGKAVEWND